jgi:CRP-like cAMP-binding protein
MSLLLKDIISLPEFSNPNDCKIVHYKPGDTILHEGEESMGVYFILHGNVSVNKRVVLYDGRHIESGFSELGPNETFGELNLFDYAPRSASVVATNDVTLARFNRDSLISYLDAHPREAYELLKKWLQRLARDLRDSNNRSGNLLAWGLNEHKMDK